MFSAAEQPPPIIFNAKAAKNRENFAKHNADREITEDGARLKIAKGHIIEAKGYEALQFFSTHHDYRRGKIRESFVPKFPSGDELFQNACLKPGPKFEQVMYSDLAIECRDPEGNLIFPEQIDNFETLNIDQQIKTNLQRMGIERPLPIQCFMIPFLLNNRQTDILAAAPTGCGKTLAVLLPLIQHCIKYKKREKRKGRTRPLNSPFAIIVGATRDLVHQLMLDALRIANDTDVDVKCAYGEYDRITNGNDIRQGCDLLIATVGRFVDLVDKDDVLVGEARFLAVDEADKLVTDEIFQDLMIVLRNRVRSNITHALFSATFSKAVRMVLPSLMRYNFVQMFMHTRGLNPFVKQEFFNIFHHFRRDHLLELLMKDAEVIPPEELLYDVTGFQNTTQYRVPKTIVYGESRRVLDYLAIFLSMNGIRSISMHGGRSQKQRNDAYNKFSSGEYQVLVASNVASRGLNFPDVYQVINYDPPYDFETYVHRLGRAGRLGSVAKNYTYFNEEDVQHMQLASNIVEEMNKLGQEIPPFLRRMAGQIQFGKSDATWEDLAVAFENGGMRFG
uniref:ATP-dependent RNA helicase n=1 Tax=Panagrolaimus sp. JU765 TaxID=591449 RepID=A0AC34R7E2_9BILA